MKGLLGLLLASYVHAATLGNMVLYVDTAGDDTGACTSPGASACATIQGALNKVDKDVRHNVLINVGPGNFGCFSVSGFRFDPQAQSIAVDGGAMPGGPVAGGASISVQGTMVESAVDAGSAIGTVSSSTVASFSGLGFIQPTMTDNAQSWVPGDLKSKFLVYTSGPRTYQRLLIHENTATKLTFASSLAVAPSVGDTYRIEEPGTVITTTCPRAPSVGVQGDGGYFPGAMIATAYVYDNVGHSIGTVRLAQMDFANPTGIGVHQHSLSNSTYEVLRFRNTANTSTRLQVDTGVGLTTVRNVAIKGTSNVFGIGAGLGTTPATGFALQVFNTLCESGRTCVASTVPTNVSAVVADPVTGFGLELRGDSSVSGYRCEGSDAGVFTACLRAGDSDGRGYCKGGLYLSAMTLNGVQAGSGIDVNGKCVVDVKGTTGFLDAGVGIRANYGAVIGVNDSATNLSGRTADVQLGDSSSFGGTAPTYYQLSNIRVFGPPTCTPAGIPYGSVLCAMP